MKTSTSDQSHQLLSQGSRRIIVKALTRNLGDPRRFLFWSRTYFRQKAKERTRISLQTDQLFIPPILIYSCTRSCNLNCSGCYASARDGREEELPLSRIKSLFAEASGLGISIIMLAGGEPLTRPEVLWAAGEQRDIIFPVFTNGLLLNRSGVEVLRAYPNLFPVISIEGGELQTDKRRGTGTHAQILQRMKQLRESSLDLGLSITLTHENYEEVTHPASLRQYLKLGASLFFFVEYVPQSREELSHCLSAGQKKELPARINRLKKDLKVPVIGLPGDEERFGGCLAGGRGFAHISASGQLEPCPFAPYSDRDIRTQSLQEALKSPLLANIRRDHHLLGEARGGCRLWENPEQVQKTLDCA